MDLSNVIEGTGGAGAKRVFSEPIEMDGAVVVFAAKVSGGGGGGEGQQATQQAGSGMGFGLSAKPAGAFVLKNGRVRWRPAIDVNRVILGGQLVAATGLLVLRSIMKARLKAQNARRRDLRFARKLLFFRRPRLFA